MHAYLKDRDTKSHKASNISPQDITVHIKLLQFVPPCKECESLSVSKFGNHGLETEV